LRILNIPFEKPVPPFEIETAFKNRGGLFLAFELPRILKFSRPRCQAAMGNVLCVSDFGRVDRFGPGALGSQADRAEKGIVDVG